VLAGEEEAHLRAVKKTTATAVCVEEAELDGRWAETTPARLLHQFPASACSKEVERGGALHVQYLTGGAGDVELERAGRGECVWEVAGVGVSPLV
jgi:hypothetical protein